MKELNETMTTIEQNEEQSSTTTNTTGQRKPSIMKKLFAAVVVLGGVSAAVLVLQSNKARSEAKLQGLVVHPTTVTVAKVTHQDISEGLSLVGTIAPSREVTISSETMGKITSISAELGSFKARGSTIAKVDDEMKRTAVTSVEINLDKARKDLDRLMQVQVENAVPDQQVDNARLAVRLYETQLIQVRRQLRDTRILSPISGVVVARTAEVGTMLQPGTPIVTVVDISSLKVRLNVSESNVFSMKVGQEVSITTDVYPGVIFSGRIANIGARGDEAHTYPVEVTLANNSQHPLKAGMFARVNFIDQKPQSGSMIPRSAVVGGVKQPNVYLYSNGTVRLVPIVLGAEAGTLVEVVKGLDDGATVVVAGQNNLRDGMKVEVAR
jgi:RND family efflux transporter MFP subunit